LHKYAEGIKMLFNLFNDERPHFLSVEPAAMPVEKNLDVSVWWQLVVKLELHTQPQKLVALLWIFLKDLLFCKLRLVLVCWHKEQLDNSSERRADIYNA